MSDAGSTQTIEPPTAQRRRTGRSIGAVVCVVLAVLLTTPAVVAFWGQRTLNDAQRYLDTVGPLVNSPEVQDAIATTVTNAIEQRVNVAPILGFLSPLEGLYAFAQVTLFGVVFFVLAMAWYAPFFAWVGGLSTIFGRWSLPLAFVIPGLLAVIENVSFFGQGPRGGTGWFFTPGPGEVGVRCFCLLVAVCCLFTACSSVSLRAPDRDSH